MIERKWTQHSLVWDQAKVVYRGLLGLVLIFFKYLEHAKYICKSEGGPRFRF